MHDLHYPCIVSKGFTLTSRAIKFQPGLCFECNGSNTNRMWDELAQLAAEFLSRDLAFA